jgi:hypothetical protein
MNDLRKILRVTSDLDAQKWRVFPMVFSGTIHSALKHPGLSRSTSIYIGFRGTLTKQLRRRTAENPI